MVKNTISRHCPFLSTVVGFHQIYSFYTSHLPKLANGDHLSELLVLHVSPTRMKAVSEFFFILFLTFFLLNSAPRILLLPVYDIFEKSLDLDPELCQRKRARYYLSHPSLQRYGSFRLLFKLYSCDFYWEATVGVEDLSFFSSLLD